MLKGKNAIVTGSTSGIGKGNRRDLVIESGKSHKFTIPEDELPS